MLAVGNYVPRTLDAFYPESDPDDPEVIILPKITSNVANSTTMFLTDFSECHTCHMITDFGYGYYLDRLLS